MELATNLDVDARRVAHELGIEVIETHGAAWVVASTGNTVLCRWSTDELVRQSRIWEGIAQCLLARLGIEWTAGQVGRLSSWLCLAAR